VDLSLADPMAGRLGTVAQLPGHTPHGAVALALLGGRLEDQSDGPLSALVDTAAARGGGALFCHDSILLQAMDSPRIRTVDRACAGQAAHPRDRLTQPESPLLRRPPKDDLVALPPEVEETRKPVGVGNAHQVELVCNGAIGI
jgi:hypothetical protein